MNESNQPQSAPNLRKLTKTNLTTEMVRSLDKFFRPKPFALQGMIQSICERKKWPRSFLSAVLCVNDGTLREWEYGKKKPPGCAVRLIWFLYTIDVAPEHAFSPLHYCTWGEIEKLPAQIVHGPDAEQKARIIAELRACKESKYRLTPWRRTVAQLSRKYDVQKETMRRWCKEAGYNPAKKTYYKKKKQLRILKPGSPWLKVDWRLKPREIAAQVLASEVSVVNNKATLRKLPKATLKRHLQACGVPIDRWEPILRWQKKIKKSVAKIISEDNISADEAKSIQLQAETNQAGPTTDVCSKQEERAVSEPQEEVRGADEDHQSRT